ncbi:MAG: TRZ/ATZ family hydrolase [Gammaproteobacteria bacterium]|nr:TRZ/ATZ family hydrolase [Gammaproteobacteria bacterium]
MHASHNFCLEAKWIIPVDYTNSEKILNDHAILVEKQLIKDILPIEAARTKYSNVPRKTLDQHAVLPGFINSHSHSPMNLLKGYADDLPLMTWLNDYIWPIEDKFFSAEFAFDGAILAIAEMLLSGITCFNDMYFYSDSIAEAVIKTGIRANIGTHVFDPPTAWANNINEYLSHCQNVLTNYKHHLITPVVCPHAPYTLSDDSFKKVIKFAEKHHLQIGCHLHETVDEINQSLNQYHIRPIERLNKLGLFDQNLYAIHMVHLNQTEIELIATKNISIAHCPKSNLKLASGFCPIKNLLDHKINIALGTDSAASNNDLDMLSEIKMSSFVTKMLSNNPTILPAHQAIAMATINGAKLMQLDKKIGSLTIGKEADIIAINLSDYGSQPVYNPLSSIVYTATRQQISDVWVNGVHKVAEHKLLNLDKNYIQNIVNKWQERIVNYKN